MVTKPRVKNTRKRYPGERGKGKYGKEIKEAVYRAFNDPKVGAHKYLVDLAASHPAVFCGLLGKVIPAELHVSGSVLIDLGKAMLEADKRLKTHNDNAAPMIDITPEPKALETKDT